MVISGTRTAYGVAGLTQTMRVMGCGEEGLTYTEGDGVRGRGLEGIFMTHEH